MSEPRGGSEFLDESTMVLLQKAAEGDLSARDLAWERVFDEVLAVAAAQRRRWSGDWTLETRALASEVFLKLSAGSPPSPNDRKHFFALVSVAVRQVLLNYAESRSALKRGGGAEPVTLSDRQEPFMDPADAERFLSLEEALRRFAKIDERATQVVELRFFSGLNYDEIAEALGISRATAVRDWSTARAWLNRELAEDVGLPGEGRESGA